MFTNLRLSEIVLPDNIVEIDSYGLYNVNGTSDNPFTSIAIPEGVTYIGDHAFCNCTSLNSVQLPEGVERWGEYAFGDCKALQNVTLPESLTTIGKHCFRYTAITSIVIPESVSNIGTEVFQGCGELQSAVLPDNMETIPMSMFSGCAALVSVNLPSNLHAIESQAFKGCSALQNIDLPESLNVIQSEAFSNSGLQSLTIVREQIKEIKLEGKSLYADAVSLNGFEEARQMAVEELRIVVGSELSEMQTTREEIETALGRTDSLCMVLQYRNMNIYKAFAYVGKDGIESAETSMADGDSVRQPSDAPADTVAENAGTDVQEAVSALVEEPVGGTEMKESEEYVRQADVAAADSITAEHVPSMADSVEVDNLIDAYQRVVDDLLAMDTYESVMLYLDGMKDDGRLIYGKMSTLVAPDEACFIIVKDGKLLAVLDRGKGANRVKIKTPKQESIQK